MGTTTVEEVAATGHPNLWFQLYVTSDRRLSDPLIDRAGAAGYKALEITIDTVVTGRRTRDMRNGLTIPPQLSPRTIIDIGRRPGYWIADVAQSGDRLRQLHRAVTRRSQERGVDAHRLAVRPFAELGRRRGHSQAVARARCCSRARSGRPTPNARSTSASPVSTCRTTAAANSIAAPRRSTCWHRCAPRSDPTSRSSSTPAFATVPTSRSRSRWVPTRRSSVARTSTRVAAAGQRGVEHVIRLLTDQLQSVMQLSGVTTLAELRKQGPELLSEPG